ncbi:MAG: hypothetical protein IPP60_17680 [Sphingobacteriales bacterium]|nr:hypothetical protein [Sphingobacteriales bacterium]
MKFLNKIRNLFAKKDKRRIPLTHVHTFKTGEKLYTYSKEYYGSIASRHYYALNEALNYITMYGADKKTVEKFFDTILDKNKQVISGINILDNALSINTLIEFQKSYIFGKTSLQLKYQEMLFCMFYLLEDEIEGGYSDVFNEKKLSLINKDQEMRDVFFLSVQTIAKDLDIILEQNTEQMIKDIVKLLEIQSQSIQSTLNVTG